MVATARSQERLVLLREAGLEATSCNRCAVESADLVFISVKPYHFPIVARDIGGIVAGKPVVSVMAGVPVSLLQKVLKGAEVYRAMPNLNIRVGRSLTALYSPPNARHYGLVRRALSCFGTVYDVPEEFIDAWTAVAGSGPALVAEFLDALVLAALAVGLPRSIARRVAAELLESTARYLLENPDVHPGVLRDEVITPAGTTIAAIRTLESRGFKSAVIDAVRDATLRAGEIAREIASMLDNSLGGSD
ncbi:Pyrroline-5-carboxylate reductase [Hyperthermus butylicus DSM 5456]|uniref:Pyrroline-5-carboxylate reductase n=1 Tax=Hyperthermus butylicus (strain DSM 5456 / JCM 9403 / PLM1-5) TaxID=415426 RepID=A2BJN9_HYPBU|nr:Pyrroline-5-carboxylate reductase [Hyperthermus butylicus DSM 5456]